MISGWLLLALTIPAPFLFVAGFYFGKGHIRHLAKNGGEERYPPVIGHVVEKYRREQFGYVLGGDDDD